MNANDPIRISEIRRARVVAASMSRFEAERQFRLSVGLVVVLVLATLAIAAATRMATAETAQVPPPITSTLS